MGPMEGILCALKVARGDYVFVSPCDTPFLKPGICELLLSRACGKDGAVPIISDRFEPVHGAFRKIGAMRAFNEAFSIGNRKPSSAYSGLNLGFVDEAAIRTVDPNLESFWNLNTPEDLRLAEKKLIETHEEDQD